MKLFGGKIDIDAGYCKCIMKNMQNLKIGAKIKISFGFVIFY